jgi:regulator of cell morphogenesis and NO signaling
MSDTATIANNVADAPQESGALIDHILARYHETHRRELPELVRLARKVEAVHADHAAVPRGLGDMLQKILGEIEVHMKKEELILFPAMRRRAGGGLAVPIAQMRHDHDDENAQLRAVAELTHGFTPPADACGSWRALYQGAAKFADDFAAHIHLENDVLFPRYEQPAA